MKEFAEKAEIEKPECYGRQSHTCQGSSDLCQSHLRVKSRSRSLGHSVCSKSMQRTVSMQGLTHTAIVATENCTITCRFMSVTGA